MTPGWSLTHASTFPATMTIHPQAINADAGTLSIGSQSIVLPGSGFVLAKVSPSGDALWLKYYQGPFELGFFVKRLSSSYAHVY